jgi:hypothetical protein
MFLQSCEEQEKTSELNCEACCSINNEPLRIVVARILVLNSTVYKKHTMKHSLNSLGEIFKPTKYGSDAT